MTNIDRIVSDVAASGMLMSKAERAALRAAAKAEAKRQKLAERDKQDAAAKAEIWDDRDGKARPTPQRRLKGVFSLRDAEDAGVSVAVDQASGTIDRLAHVRVITSRQREAGHIFEEVVRGSIGSPAGRSCVDFSPVGYDGDEADDESAQRAQSRWRSLRRMLPPKQRQECMAVCWQGQLPRSIGLLREALTVVGDWAGLEQERA